MIPEIDPRLVEECVIRGVEGHPVQTRFRFRRNPLYEIEDPEKREEAFQRLHLRWFRLLEYDRPILRVLEESPRVSREVHRIVVAPAASRQEEGAELFVSPPEEGLPEARRRSVGIQVLPETVLDGLIKLQDKIQNEYKTGDRGAPESRPEVIEA